MNVDLIKDIFLPFVMGLISTSLVVFLGVKSIRDYLKLIEEKKEYGHLKRFWNIKKKERKYILVFGSEPPKDEEYEVEQRVGYSQSFAVSEITQLLQRINGENVSIEQVILTKSDPIPKHCFDENVILFGGELVLSKFRELNLLLKIPFYQHRLDLKKRSFTRKEGEEIIEEMKSIVDLSSKNIITDFGTVTRIINPLNNNLMIFFNANYSAGLLGAVLTVTQKQRFPEATFDEKSIAQQLVVEVPNIKGNLLQRNHPVIPKQWIKFSIDIKMVSEAIESVTD